MKREIEAIIFDYGRVVSTDQDEQSLNEMCRLLKLPRREFKESYFKFRPDYDAALLTANKYWQKICDHHYITCSKRMVNILTQLDTKSWIVINIKMKDYFLGLKSYHVKKAMISNMPRDILEYINANFTWFDIFDVTVYSCDMKKCKPEKIIYYRCLELLHLQPDKCLFIDDSNKNIKSAEEIGIHTILFKDYNQCIMEIENNYTFE
jgi:FMN phosphatase YigB (HAD superfamily)